MLLHKIRKTYLSYAREGGDDILILVSYANFKNLSVKVSLATWLTCHKWPYYWTYWCVWINITHWHKYRVKQLLICWNVVTRKMRQSFTIVTVRISSCPDLCSAVVTSRTIDFVSLTFDLASPVSGDVRSRHIFLILCDIPVSFKSYRTSPLIFATTGPLPAYKIFDQVYLHSTIVSFAQYSTDL